MPEQPPQGAPGTVPVVDRRTAPRGVIPRSAQTWLMLGLAIGILGIIAITGSPDSPPRPVDVPAMSTSTPSPSRLRDFQDRLRLLDERARLEAVQSQTPPAPEPRAEVIESTPQADPLADERRRREYESRFARVTILARHPEKQVPSFAQPEGQSVLPEPFDGVNLSRTSGTPSLDAVAEAVLRASQRQMNAAAVPIAKDTASAVPDAQSESPRTAPARNPSLGPTHRIPEGTLLETVLWNKLNLAGDSAVICRVTTPLYSRDLEHVLIPADTLVLGQTKTVGGGGQDPLLAVAFHQLRMPDDTRYELKHASALNREGDSGLHDRLNRHYATTFGAAGAIGLITGLAQTVGIRTGESRDGDRTVIIAGSAADASTQAATQALNHFLNRQPTGEIRRDHRVLVYLTHDLDLPPYKKLASAGALNR